MRTIGLVALSKVLGGTTGAPTPAGAAEQTAAAQPTSAAQTASAAQPTTERIALAGGGWKQTTTWPSGQMVQMTDGKGMVSFWFSFSSTSPQSLGA